LCGKHGNVPHATAEIEHPHASPNARIAKQSLGEWRKKASLADQSQMLRVSIT
jgi:hypothetical protein